MLRERSLSTRGPTQRFLYKMPKCRRGQNLPSVRLIQNLLDSYAMTTPHWMLHISLTFPFRCSHHFKWSVKYIFSLLFTFLNLRWWFNQWNLTYREDPEGLFFRIRLTWQMIWVWQRTVLNSWGNNVVFILHSQVQFKQLFADVSLTIL